MNSTFPLMENVYDLIGLPQSLRSTFELSLEQNDWNIPFISELVTQRHGSPRSGGCNSDAFSVFGFLAFLLAAANLLMMNQAGGGGKRRRKRELFGPDAACTFNANYGKEATLASYSMLRGFLNAMDASSSECSNLFICEASYEAARLGPVGKMLAKVASSNAESWLTSLNSTQHSGTGKAGLQGSLNDQPCAELYKCAEKPKSYKPPHFI